MLKVLNQFELSAKRPKINILNSELLKLNKNKMPHKIYKVNIPVTDIPWLCGMDHYGNRNKSICRIWKQLYNDDYKKIEYLVRKNGNACSLDSNIKKIKMLETKSGTNINTSNMITNINQQFNSSSKNLVENQSQIASEIKSCNKLTEEEKNKMVKLMNSATNVVYGTRNENRGLTAFTNITGKIILDRQTKLIYQFDTSTLPNGDKVEWNITGKYDGVTTDDEIVEIKNRQSCLFNEIRDYEMCQIQMYLYMLNVKIGYLVEVLGAKSESDNQINILQTEKIDDYFDLVIKSYLNDIVKYVLDLPFKDIAEKIKLMSC